MRNKRSKKLSSISSTLDAALHNSRIRAKFVLIISSIQFPDLHLIWYLPIAKQMSHKAGALKTVHKVILQL